MKKTAEGEPTQHAGYCYYLLFIIHYYLLVTHKKTLVLFKRHTRAPTSSLGTSSSPTRSSGP